MIGKKLTTWLFLSLFSMTGNVLAHGKDASFSDDGQVKDYGPTGTGQLDYDKYIKLLKTHTNISYFVLEYYKNREDLIRARDIVSAEILRSE